MARSSSLSSRWALIPLLLMRSGPTARSFTLHAGQRGPPLLGDPMAPREEHFRAGTRSPSEYVSPSSSIVLLHRPLCLLSCEWLAVSSQGMQPSGLPYEATHHDHYAIAVSQVRECAVGCAAASPLPLLIQMPRAVLGEFLCGCMPSILAQVPFARRRD